MLSIRWWVGGSNSVIFQSSRRALPLDRIVVLTVLPTPIGSGEVSSSLSTLSSHCGRLRASATNANTSSIGFPIVTEALRVNILCSLRRLATLDDDSRQGRPRSFVCLVYQAGIPFAEHLKDEQRGRRRESVYIGIGALLVILILVIIFAS